jgi:NAD(P)-dependent dehydrogenase (short-subunit alcohol dehydrogenase family)
VVTESNMKGDPVLQNPFSQNSFGLEGKVALVTGASGAIGRDIAISMARAGADIIAVGRNRNRLEETVEQVNGVGRKAFSITADLSLMEEVKGIVQESMVKTGRVDVLVNNAAANIMKMATDFSEADFDTILHTNLKGPFFLSQLVAEKMRASQGGNIIFITSQLGKTAMNFACLYGATKAALMQITRSLALEWARYQIRVNSVSPGPWSTGMLEPLFRDGKTQDRLARLTPRGRLGGEGDIGGTVIFLASDAARHITGQDIIVDGGFSICRIL